MIEFLEANPRLVLMTALGFGLAAGVLITGLAGERKCEKCRKMRKSANKELARMAEQDWAEQTGVEPKCPCSAREVCEGCGNRLNEGGNDMLKSILAKLKGVLEKCLEKGKKDTNKYCEKTAVIEAYQFTKENFRRDKEPIWLKRAISDGEITLFSQYGGNAIGGDVKTPGGLVEIFENDYIIKGVQGEFYPCKPDMFESTYEPVEE